MSDPELKAFENQLSFLSYTEQLSVMEFLIKLMKKNQQKAPASKTQSKADKIFTLMDANPVYLNGQKWSREELYER
ncbi:MAG: hypothetical protein IJJ70_07935 [Treponema sp.]|nr:hypothetical protein [Treponema sp.]